MILFSGIHFFPKWPLCLREGRSTPATGVDLSGLDLRNLVSLAREGVSTQDIRQTVQKIPETIVTGQC